MTPTNAPRLIVVFCAWCQDGIADGLPRAEALQQARRHVLSCPDHPAKKLEGDVRKLRMALANLAFAKPGDDRTAILKAAQDILHETA